MRQVCGVFASITAFKAVGCVAVNIKVQPLGRVV